MMKESSVNMKRANHERRKTMRELEQRLARLQKLQNALRVLEQARDEKEEDKLPKIENQKLAKKYNFVQLRKK